MPHYDWKGIRGTQYEAGRIEGLSEDEASFKLSQQGVIITQLVLAHREKNQGRPAPPKKIRARVSSQEVLIMTRKAATMLKAGLPILQTLEMLRDQIEKPSFNRLFSEIVEDVRSGNPLSSGFAKHATIFDSIYVNLIKAGEASGKLDVFLQRLVVSLETTLRIRSAIKSAMLYPAILMTVALGVLAVMMVYVVPVFAQMYGNTGMELPGPTRIVINISDFLRDPLSGGVLALVIVGTAIGFSFAIRKSKHLRYRWHALILRILVFGNLVLKSGLARIAMVQGNLAAAGVPLIESLDIAGSASSNLVIRKAMEDVKRGVYSGTPLSQLLREQKIIPRTYADMVEVGERTGNMQEMLSSISQYYEEEFNTEVERLSALMEPIMIVFLGVTIGFILVAMYLPIFGMGKAITG